jgi:SAM-dependent methyltransferase
MDWEWDETLFRGAARYYMLGRHPYAAGLADEAARALDLDGRGRLIDVGCGPGVIGLCFAHLFEEVVGVDPDQDMLDEAERLAGERNIGNARWVKARGEDLPAGLGTFLVATFSRSFHWMDRDAVAATMLAMLEPGGAFVQVTETSDGVPEPGGPLPHPLPPRKAITEILHRYLGPERRAGQGIRTTSPDGEDAVVVRAGFGPVQRVRVVGRQVLIRTVDDVLASYYSRSSAAPHLFGDRLGDFDAEVRRSLAEASPSGLFAERTRDTEIRIWRKPE